MKILFRLAIIALIFTSCGSVNKRLLQGGSVVQEVFLEKIPFVFEHDLPFVEVEIEGVTYRFLLDTGAPTVISYELMDKLQLKPRSKININDSQGNRKKERTVKIPEIRLGNVAFQNIGAAVVDLNHTFEIKCLKIDGILGANQMSKAIWEINYATQEIIVTNDLANLDLTSVDHSLQFRTPSPQKTPKVKATIGETSYYLTYDTGSNNFLELPIHRYRDTIRTMPHISNYGSTSAGVYGISKADTLLYTKLPLLLLDTTKFENHIVSFDHTSAVIGNRFLKNFTTILDWNTQIIYLKKVSNHHTDYLETFGVKYRYHEGKFIVTEISLDMGHNIQLGDIIHSINDLNFINISESDACDYLFNSPLRKAETKPDTATIIYSRDDEVKTEVLHKKRFFED